MSLLRNITVAASMVPTLVGGMRAHADGPTLPPPAAAPAIIEMPVKQRKPTPEELAAPVPLTVPIIVDPKAAPAQAPAEAEPTLAEQTLATQSLVRGENEDPQLFTMRVMQAIGQEIGHKVPEFGATKGVVDEAGNPVLVFDQFGNLTQAQQKITFTEKMEALILALKASRPPREDGKPVVDIPTLATSEDPSKIFNNLNNLTLQAPLLVGLPPATSKIELTEPRNRKNWATRENWNRVADFTGEVMSPVLDKLRAEAKATRDSLNPRPDQDPLPGNKDHVEKIKRI